MTPDLMPLIVVDCRYLCYQAAYTMHGLEYNDQATGVIFGFLDRIQQLGQFLQSNRFVFCWDSASSKRKLKYPWYKRGRVTNQSPEQHMIRKQVNAQSHLLKEEILPLLGFRNVVEQDGYEADDIMARVCIDRVEPTILVTADEDLFQCLCRHVKIWNPSKKQMMTQTKFVSKYGIIPQQWAMVKAIAGCSSDSIPGVGGVGEKTAIQYMRDELPDTSKKHMAIVCDTGRQIIGKNTWLIRLPHPGARKMTTLLSDEFSMYGFEGVVSKYGITSFVSNEWLNFFNGNFSAPQQEVKDRIRDAMKKDLQ